MTVDGSDLFFILSVPSLFVKGYENFLFLQEGKAQLAVYPILPCSETLF